ncbi:MAG TPA: GNAT family N-acetyltransferase [Actinomycetota bacterium]|nr:GNAT family N-acetyltransferase [Actinomycetota bacterium]
MTSNPVAEAYPEHWEADVILRDGRICHIRPIRPEDREGLAAFHETLSAETVYYRFFAPYPKLTDRDLQRFTTVDYIDRVALVAVVAGQIIGVGRYDRIDRAEAEVAFVISDDHQGRGLGSILLEHLAVAARERGIARFVAEVLPTNRRMLATFEEAGFKPTQAMDEGVVKLHFDISPTPLSRDVMQAREQRAEARSVASLLSPRSVALMGASRREGTVGNVLLHNLRDARFTGSLVAIHAEADSIAGVPCFPSLAEAPGPIDLVVVAVPADRVLAAIGEAGDAGVLGAVVVSAGFAESGGEGRVLQRRLIQHARANGLRIIGPNALGIINTDPHIQLNASLISGGIPRGRIGFFAQSGALGASLLMTANDRGLGVSTFVSAGNRADVSANDLLQYWEDDDATGLVLLYLESIGNPRKFARVARRLGARKPIVAVRSGRSTQSLPLGHTVRRTALPTQAIDAMFEQAGVMQVDSLSELFDVASLLTFQPLPRGRRVAVVGNSDALGVLTADACEANGLDVAGDPVLLDHHTDLARLSEAVERAIQSPDSDSVIVLHVPVIRGDDPHVTEALRGLAENSTKPLLAVLMAEEHDRRVIAVEGPHGLPGRGSVPIFHEVEPAVRALSTLVTHARWLETPRGTVPHLPDVSPTRARAVMREIRDRAISGHGEQALVPVDNPDLQRLLNCYGIRLWDSHIVTSEAQAVGVARQVGYPIVLKTAHPGLVHRPDLGGVRVNLENEAAVRTAYLSMIATLPAEAQKRLILQQQAPAGVACVVEKREDALFGPVVSFGIAGEVTRLLQDRGFRIPPLTDRDVDDLIKAPKAAPLLFGYRNSPPVDIELLAGLLHRVGQLADDMPELTRLELNPIIVSGRSLAVVGAAAWSGPAMIRADLEARRLPG